MKTIKFAAFVGMVIILSAGCAPVRIYSNKGLTEKTGLKYYTVKPYLHV